MWWVDVLKKDQIIDSLLWLLLKDIKRDSFVQDSAQFGIDWISSCVLHPKVVD
jgi:hypothetical protein